MGLALFAAPAEEPVTISDVLAQTKVEESAEHDRLAAMISAARQHVESVCGRSLVTQTWDLTLDGFPVCDREIRLPRGPVASVTYVKYDDSLGAEQTFSSTNYIVDGTHPARIVLKQVASWPTTSGEVKSVRVRYVSGVVEESVEQPIKSAILLLVEALFYRGELESPAADALLANYRLGGVG